MIRNLIASVLAVFALNAFAAIDVNQASRAELETVKGIGPGLSGKIIDARKTGGFRNWDDLVDRVGGIGTANAGKLSQGGLTVAGTGYDGKAADPAAKGKAAKTAAKAPRTSKSADKAAAKRADKAHD